MRAIPASIATLFALALSLDAFAAAAAPAEAPPAGFSAVAFRDLHSPLGGTVGSSAASDPGRVAGAFVPFAWPLERALHDRLLIANYMDHDPLAPIVDYMGLTHAYDGHEGVDLVVPTFRDQDEGVEVWAASPGQVVLTEWSLADRNTAQVPGTPANLVTVLHPEDIRSRYVHLRRNSVAVEVGEQVEAGDFLGYVASSGSSTGPHLHFDAGSLVGGVYVPRDPWNGPSSPQPTLWASPAAYVGDDAPRVIELGTSTRAGAGGSVSPIARERLLDRLTQPAVTGIDEPELVVWYCAQFLAGQQLRVEVRKPNATLWRSVNYTAPATARLAYHSWFWFFSGQVASGDVGTWTVQVLTGGVPIATHAFEVGLTTAYAPRFFPLAGRSFRFTGAEIRDTLRVSPLGGPVTYALLVAPAGTGLVADSIVVIPAAHQQPLRNAWFRAVATDAAARTDTMRYHIVDPAKPRQGTTAVEPGPGLRSTGQAWPNPSSLVCELRFAAPAAGTALRIELFDARGRRVRTLEAPAVDGLARAEWDGRDEAGARVPPGLYFARPAGERGALRIARMR